MHTHTHGRHRSKHISALVCPPPEACAIPPRACTGYDSRQHDQIAGTHIRMLLPFLHATRSHFARQRCCFSSSWEHVVLCERGWVANRSVNLLRVEPRAIFQERLLSSGLLQLFATESPSTKDLVRGLLLKYAACCLDSNRLSSILTDLLIVTIIQLRIAIPAARGARLQPQSWDASTRFELWTPMPG